MMLYIDPGTGSMLFTILIGVIGAAVYSLRMLWIKLRFKLSGGKAELTQQKIPIAIFSDDKRYWSIFEPICRELDARGMDVVYMTASADDPALQNTYEHVKAEFIGEESENNFSFKGLRFIIDPIDGTTNFMQDYHCSCISVALCEKDDVIKAVVYNPYTGELFSAEKGKGAYLNGERIRVSERPLSDGLALFGTSPYYPRNTDETFALLRKVFDLSRDIRRNGAAAYDICLVSCGRAEVFFEKTLQPWDIAAGTLIIKEAGGLARNYEGCEIDLTKADDVVFANPKAYEEFKALL